MKRWKILASTQIYSLEETVMGNLIYLQVFKSFLKKALSYLFTDKILTRGEDKVHIMNVIVFN
jgi:hypothetical protein